MSKVSIGLRGWRFEEADVFTDDGDLKPLDDIPSEPRERLLRLTTLVEEPCDACYLAHGEAHVERAAPAEIVYGEPLGEVLLCAEHEPEFLYWFREAGGDEYRGEEQLSDRFHDWFADGGRAPEEYPGMDHVDAEPEALPDPPDQREVQERLEENFDGTRIDLRAHDDELFGDSDDEKLTEEDLENSDLDLSTEYPDS